MRVVAGKLLVSVLMGGAIAASLALPRVFDSAQRPWDRSLPTTVASEPQVVYAPSSIFQRAAHLKPLPAFSVPLAVPRLSLHVAVPVPVAAAAAPQRSIVRTPLRPEPVASPAPPPAQPAAPAQPTPTPAPAPTPAPPPQASPPPPVAPAAPAPTPVAPAAPPPAAPTTDNGKGHDNANDNGNKVVAETAPQADQNQNQNGHDGEHGGGNGHDEHGGHGDHGGGGGEHGGGGGDHGNGNGHGD